MTMMVMSGLMRRAMGRRRKVFGTGRARDQVLCVSAARCCLREEGQTYIENPEGPVKLPLDELQRKNIGCQSRRNHRQKDGFGTDGERASTWRGARPARILRRTGNTWKKQQRSAAARPRPARYIRKDGEQNRGRVERNAYVFVAMNRTRWKGIQSGAGTHWLW